MNARSKIAGIAGFAAILGLGISVANADSADKPANINPTSGSTNVAWKIFSSPASPDNSTDNLPAGSASQDKLAAQPLTGADSAPLTWSALQASADAPATVNHSAGQARTNINQNVSLPSSTQDLTMDGNPRSGGINHAGKSVQSTGTVSVPLPTAAWTGLTALLGLGVFAYGKKIIQRLA